MPDILTMEITDIETLELELNADRIDPYLIIEDLEVIAPDRIVDDEMSDTSTNTVQNKIIKEYVDTHTASRYVHTQISANILWIVSHNLGKYPSVSVVDSGNTVVVGEVVYLTSNALQITFSSAFSGKAYCN